MRIYTDSMRSTDMADETLYIGIDLGTFRSVLVTSGGQEEIVLTVVGTPKDTIARNFLRADCLFGEEALRNRLALDLYRPLEHGVIKDTMEDKKHIASFIQYIISLANPDDYDRVVAVIGAPAEASHVDKTAIFSAASGAVNACMIISEPFAVAYALDRIENAVVIDIGAGTADMCRVYGTIPGPEDQLHNSYAGDHIDRALIEAIATKYAGSQVTKDMARRWKEEHGFVTGHEPEQPIIVDFSVEGKAMSLDITDCVAAACDSVVEPIIGGVKALIADSNPEYQKKFRTNMIVGGGGSGIRGIGEAFSIRLQELGDVEVHTVEDSIRLGAIGGLRLGQEVPEEYWKNLTFSEA